MLLLVDTTAFLQGVGDTEQAGWITQQEYYDICQHVLKLSHVGSVGRRVCGYQELLEALAGFELSSFSTQQLWKRIGPSLISGLGVADSCEQTARRTKERNNE